MRYLFNLFSIALLKYSKSFDANLHAEFPLVNVTKPAICVRLIAKERNIPRQLVDCGENFPDAAYIS